MTKNVIVVGMPRSGTSMTTAIFARKGYFIAEDEARQLRKGDEYNPAGYFEAEPLIKSNTAVFNAAGFPYDNTWLYEPITKQQSDAIFDVQPVPEHAQLVIKYNKHSPWIWKDPRLCYTLAYWWPLMDPKNTLVLFLKRDPKQILQSFLRLKWRGNTEEEKQDVYKRINEHLSFARATIEKFNIPHIVIDYSDYAKTPEKTAERMSAFFGLSISPGDLGYSDRLNNSGLRGRLSNRVDKLADRVPDKLRKFIKRLIPASLLRLLFPGRYKR